MLSAVLTLAGLGFLAALGLAVASRVFYVKMDPRVSTIVDILPGANCGGCGYGGCSALAQAIVSGEGNIEACSAIDDEGARAIADIMGIEYTDSEKERAVVLCRHADGGVKDTFTYAGISDCRAANLIGGGPKACKYACIGLGTCASVCPFGAIVMSADGLPIIDPNTCTGCGVCVAECPKNVLMLVPVSSAVSVHCSSRDKGAAVKKICSTGCIGCAACVRVCPFEAMTLVDNLAAVDYSKCRVCGLCVSVCPTNAIRDHRDELKVRKVAVIGDDCNGCSLCSRACPVDAITGTPKEQYTVDPTRCIGCGICADLCKRGAISMITVDGTDDRAINTAASAGGGGR
ncbi:MAG: RnfABCDGE type electron transport complex subunit B [Deltaproteobacteria bacterium]|nr:RnfABCDGE type electron transport complex subunit B [Candidatus Zymogenaceae bacterium]